MLGPQRCVAKVKISERKFNRYQRGFPERYYAEKTALNQVCETGQIMFPNSSAIIHYVLTKKTLTLCFCHQVRRRRPDTRLNLQYDKLYVNNVAYWFNEDTEEIELVNQSDGDIESQVLCGCGEVHTLCVTSKYFCLAIKSTFAHIFRLS